jgi:hypothetical protein
MAEAGSGRAVPRPAKSGIGGVKGHNMNDITIPGSPALPVPSRRDKRGASIYPMPHGHVIGGEADGECLGTDKSVLDLEYGVNERG